MIETKGFNELCKKLESMGAEGAVIGKQALKQGSKTMLSQMKQDAPKLTGRGAANLKECKTKKTARGLYLFVGIDAKNWDACRGLYFHHYGAYSRAGSLWMNGSFEKAYAPCQAEIKQLLIRQIGWMWDK